MQSRIGPTIKKTLRVEASLQAKTLKAVGVTDGPLVLMCVKVYHRATPEVGEYTTKNKEKTKKAMLMASIFLKQNQ